MNKKTKQVIDEDLLTSEEEEVFVEQNSAQDESANQEKDQSIEQKLDEVEQAVSKNSSKKKRIWNWIFFALNIVVVAGILIYQLSKEQIVSPFGLPIHYIPLLLLILVFMVELFSEAFGISYLIKRNVGKFRYGLAYKVNALGRHYDSVTPMATGGQPFQIAYLKNHEVPLHSAMSIPIAKMMFHQICWTVISLVCVIISFVNPKYNTFVSIASVIGFVLGSAVLFLIVFLSISRNVGRKMVVWVLKLLQKMKILKNYEKYYQKITKLVEDYQSVMRQYAKSPRDFVVILLTLFVKLVAQYSLPFFVFCLFNGFDWSRFSDFFVMSVLIDLAAGFFPLPGGTGMSEYTFYAMFEHYFPEPGILFWALLVWRFLSYYFFILQGITILSYDMFYGNRKFKWQQRKSTLIQESQIFKQEQINRFRAERKKQRRVTKSKRLV